MQEQTVHGGLRKLQPCHGQTVSLPKPGDCPLPGSVDKTETFKVFVKRGNLHFVRRKRTGRRKIDGDIMAKRGEANDTFSVANWSGSDVRRNRIVGVAALEIADYHLNLRTPGSNGNGVGPCMADEFESLAGNGSTLKGLAKKLE